MIDLSRRNILAGLAGSLAIPGLALAAPATDRRLVFIVLRGAMDGIATLMPVGDPAYAALRGSFGPPPAAGAPLTLDPMWQLHPALAEVGMLYGRGEAAFVHAVASPYRERSHFEAQNVLETGGTAAYALKDGWLNRLLPLLPRAEPAVAITPTVPMLLRGPAPATSYAPSQLPDADAALLARVEALYQDDAQLHALWGQAVDARQTAGTDGQGRANPAALGKMAATFLAKPNGARVAVIEIGGWDTHANQPGRLTAQLRQLDATIAALRTGLGPAWADTLVIAATEFGRTARPNGTGGTDHGTGGAALLAGGTLAKAQVIADWPGLAPAQLHEGRDLRPTLDLRALLAGLAAEQFGLDPARVARTVFAPDVRPLTGLVRA
ncbi:DUF1501 domain-containing protein [Polymorphobacter sp.]|uniref:DUF1501 domain-containing protein n=1 Tax=Polymorphobacter sp. TaxID=1909290 RepID=UPI003F6E50E1